MTNIQKKLPDQNGLASRTGGHGSSERAVRPAWGDHTRPESVDLLPKRADSQVSDSDQKLRGLFELSPFGIVLTDLQGNYLDFNEAFLAICGYSRDELKTLDYWTLTPKKYEPDEFRILEILHTTGRFGPLEKEYIRKDGSLIPVQLNGMVITGEDGRKFTWTIIQDITERNNALRVIKESENRFQQLMDNMVEGYFIIDFDMRYVYMNKSAELQARCAPGQLIGKSLYKVLPVTENGALHAALKRVMSGRVADYIEASFQVMDGETSWFELRIAPVEQGISVISVDITQRRRIEIELEQKRSVVTYLSRLAILGELSGAIAHELNQPLMSILMNAESAKVLLGRDDYSKQEVNEILTEIVDEDVRASGIIQRLRKLFAQREVISVAVNVNELLTNVGKILNNELINRGIHLQLQLDADIPAVNIDRIQIEQVLINLIMNASDAVAAIDANLDRTVICATSRENNGVKVAVIDHGTGIAPALLPTIFDPFVTTKQQGMGLGLSICRTIINAHAGALWAQNNAQAGSSFFFTLPGGAQS